jgi:inner membrane protein
VLDVDAYAAEHDLSDLHREDIARFEYFSAGYLVEDPRHDGVVSDFRYAMVPNDIAPLWGIDVLGTPPGEHLAWLQFRDLDGSDREAFMDMILGR